ncbi:MAG: hypothetical protein IKU45_01315 [Clostridia bacterium]|nr:hypothetical protein [Clostridia bacterium]
MYKKVLALMLVLSFCLGVLSACGGEAVELLDFAYDNSAENMDGYVFTLMQTSASDSSSGKLSNENIFGYLTNTTFADAVRKRIDEVEEKYNCSIEINTTDYDGKLLVSMVIADTIKYEAMYSSCHEYTMDAAASRALLPLSDYADYIDIGNEDKYGTPNVFEINSYKGEMYGLTPISWVYKDPRAIGLLVFNMEYVGQYGLRDPREFLESETWNWDALEYVIKNCYVKEADKEIYALAARPFDFAKLLAMSNGMKLAYYGEDGTVKSDFDSNKMTEAMDMYGHLVQEYSDHFKFKNTSDSANWPEIRESFCDDQDSMVCVTAPNVLFYDIIYEVNEFAVMPFPTGPSRNYGEWASALEAAECFSVFSTAKEPEYAFTLIDGIAEPLEGYETKDLIADFLGELALYNKSDADVVLNLYRYGEYTYWSEDEGFNLDSMYKTAARNAGSKAPSEVIGTYGAKVDQYIKEYIAPNLAVYDYFEEN